MRRVNRHELHAKLAKLKDTLLARHKEGVSIVLLADEYDIKYFTLASWMRYWETGKGKLRDINGVPYRRKWSKEFLARQKYNNEVNAGPNGIKYIKGGQGYYEKIIHQICCGSV